VAIPEHQTGRSRVTRLPQLWTVLVLSCSPLGCGPNPTAARPAEAATRDSTAAPPAAQSASGSDSSQPDSTAADPSRSQPVTAALEIRPPSVAGGATVEILVHIRIAPLHHLTADDPSGTFDPLSVELNLPDGLEPGGDWQFPPPQEGHAGTHEYRKGVLLRRSVRVSSSVASGSLPITGKLHCQVCTEELCWPKQAISLQTSLSITP
jgi:hypothetical protein